MIIPGGDPREVLMCQGEVRISAVLGEACAVVVESEDLARRVTGTSIFAEDTSFVFVDVVSKVDWNPSDDCRAP